MVPVSWLTERSRCLSAVREPSCVGMVPVSWLSLRYRLVSAARLPSCAGMVPVSWLTERFRVVRFVRLPSCAGILPEIAEEARSSPERVLMNAVKSIPVTLAFETVMPVQFEIFFSVAVPVPQVRNGWLWVRLLLAGCDAQ